jgi:hypothetical protein
LPRVRVCGLRRARHVGEAKVPLQHVATAAAINVLRISDWLIDKPRKQTRPSAFVKLMAPAPQHDEFASSIESAGGFLSNRDQQGVQAYGT